MSKKVLIVDDEPDVIAYLTAVLESNGYHASAAQNADQALQMVKDMQPDLIFLDIMMPGESGISLYLKLHAEDLLRRIPVLIISGLAKEQEFDFRQHVTDKDIPLPAKYIEKPINVTELLDILKQLIGTGDIANDVSPHKN